MEVNQQRNWLGLNLQIVFEEKPGKMLLMVNQGDDVEKKTVILRHTDRKGDLVNDVVEELMEKKMNTVDQGVRYQESVTRDTGVVVLN